MGRRKKKKRKKNGRFSSVGEGGRGREGEIVRRKRPAIDSPCLFLFLSQRLVAT